MPDVCHTFRDRPSHHGADSERWFPLADRNPQVFIDIPKAKAADFKKATERVYHDSVLTVWMM